MAGNSGNWHKPTQGKLKGQKIFVRKDTMDALGMTRAQVLDALNTMDKHTLQVIAEQRPVSGLAIRKNEAGVLDARTQADLDNASANLRFDRFTPVKGTLNGVKFSKADPTHWERAKEKNFADEPPLPNTSKRIATGVVIMEPDGRMWLYKPSLGFDNRDHTWSGGGLERGLGPQQNAVKEAYEELGLNVEITGFLADAEVSDGYRRYYVAKRVGGNPADHAWEAENIKLMRPEKARTMFNSKLDQDLTDLAVKKARTGKGAREVIRYGRVKEAAQRFAALGAPQTDQTVSVISRSGARVNAKRATVQGELAVYEDRLGNQVVAHLPSGQTLLRTASGYRSAVAAMEQMNQRVGWSTKALTDFDDDQIRALSASARRLRRPNGGGDTATRVGASAGQPAAAPAAAPATRTPAPAPAASGGRTRQATPRPGSRSPRPVITEQWQTVPLDSVLPAGVEAKIDVQTQTMRVRLKPGR